MADEQHNLYAAYVELRDHPGLADSHVSIDRDRSGEEAVNVLPNWLDAPAVALVLDVARRLELALALTSGGLRLAEHGGPLERGVDAVRDAIAEDDDA